MKGFGDPAAAGKNCAGCDKCDGKPCCGGCGDKSKAAKTDGKMPVKATKAVPGTEGAQGATGPAGKAAGCNGCNGCSGCGEKAKGCCGGCDKSEKKKTEAPAKVGS